MQEAPDVSEILEIVKVIVKLIDEYTKDGEISDHAIIITLLMAFFCLVVLVSLTTLRLFYKV